jgi:hypothetical protein
MRPTGSGKSSRQRTWSSVLKLVLIPWQVRHLRFQFFTSDEIDALSIEQELSFCTCRDTDERRLSKIPDQDHVTADVTAHGKQLLAVARPTESEDSSRLEVGDLLCRSARQ